MRDYNQIPSSPQSDFQGIYGVKPAAVDRFIRDRAGTMREYKGCQGVATLIFYCAQVDCSRPSTTAVNYGWR